MHTYLHFCMHYLTNAKWKAMENMAPPCIHAHLPTSMHPDIYHGMQQCGLPSQYAHITALIHRLSHNSLIASCPVMPTTTSKHAKQLSTSCKACFCPALSTTFQNAQQ